MAAAYDLAGKREAAYLKAKQGEKREKDKKKGAAAAASVVKQEKMGSAGRLIRASMAGGFYYAKRSHLEAFRKPGTSGTGRHDGALTKLMEAEVRGCGKDCYNVCGPTTHLSLPIPSCGLIALLSRSPTHCMLTDAWGGGGRRRGGGGRRGGGSRDRVPRRGGGAQHGPGAR